MSIAHNERFQLDRLAFFSDPVFAIAITLLVIEIHVPEIHSDAELGRALLTLIPKYIGFIVSFFVIGRFWIGHHRVFGLLMRCDDGLVAANLLLLMAIAFGPFPTALVSEYVGGRTAVAVYTGWLIVTGLLSRRVMLYARRHPLLWAPQVDQARFAGFLIGSWTPIIIGVLAFAFSLVHPPLALIPLMLSPVILAAVRYVVDRSQSRRSASETETTT